MDPSLPALPVAPGAAVAPAAGPYAGLLPVSLDLLPVAIYARLSRNPDGTKDSVEAQVEIGIREAAARWPGRPYLIFTDDDISATDDDEKTPEQKRPGYKALCDAIRGRQVGDVLTRLQSRISRGEAVWPHWKSVCLLAGITVLHTWLEGDVDLSPDKAMPGNVRNLFNTEMALITRLGVKDRLDYNASVGTPPGGHRYGYRKGDRVIGPNGKLTGTLEVVDEHDVTLNRMAEWILSGESQADIARWLNAEGSRTATGALWRPSKIREVLCNPIIAGFRTHQVKAARIAARGPDAKPHPYDGIVGRGNWKPIIDEDRWRLLVAHFTGDRTVTAKTGEAVTVKPSKGRARAYLLAGGLIRCGKCLARLHSGTYMSRKGVPLPSYRCITSEGGCGGTSISAPRVEAWVAAEVRARLGDEDVIRDLMNEADEDAEVRAHIKERRAALAAQRKEMTDRAAAEGASFATVAEFGRSIDKAEAALTKQEAGLSVAKAVVDYEAVAEGFDGMTFGEQRTVLFAIGTLVTVGPAAGGVTPPESRLSIEFGEAPAPRERAKPRRSRRATKTA